MPEKYNKPALTFKQQLELLESRGLKIGDRVAAEAFLADTNYYRLSAYCIPFQSKRDVFIPGATFENIQALYDFDRKLRACVIQGLERFEVAFKTAVANHLADRYGAFAHITPDNFDPRLVHLQWHSKLIEEIERSQETFIDHYKTKYEGFPLLPIWMAIEVMSFGSLSKLYWGLKRADQTAIARQFNLAPPVLASWVHTLVVIRNLCAHHSRLWNRVLGVAPLIPRTDVNWHPPSFSQSKRTAGALFVMNHLLKGLQRGPALAPSWRKSIVDLCNAGVPVNDFESHMGFPVGWRTHPLWR